MKTIVVASQKGGSGKTMLTAHLAVEAESEGNTAWVIDTDPQGTLTHWHERRKAETPQRFDVPIERLRAGLKKIAEQGAAFCFIDTAPSVTSQNVALFEQADLVLIPVRPSPSDLWAVSATVEKVKEAGKPFLFVITQAKAQASITAQAVAALSKHGPVVEGFISDRVVYASAMTGGNTAPEIAKAHTAREVAQIWQQVKAIFQQNSKTAKAVMHG